MRKKKLCAIVLALVMAGAVSMMSGTVAFANYNQEAEGSDKADEGEIGKNEVPQVVREEKPDGTPFSIAGNGEVLDDISDEETKQFITVRTKNNQTFFVVIDRANSIDNVYMLSMIDENDLEEFLEDAGDEADKPQVVIPENSGVEMDENGNPITSDAVMEESKSDGDSGGLLWMAIGVIVLGGGGYYYFKIRKPKQAGGASAGNGSQYDANSEEDSEYNDDDEYEDDDAEYDDEYDEDSEMENDEEELDFEFEDEDAGAAEEMLMEDQAKETGNRQEEYSAAGVEDNTEDYYEEDEDTVEPEKPVRRRRRRRSKKAQIEQS